MKVTINKNVLIKVLKYFGLAIGGFFILLLILPLFFTDDITKQVKKLANERINGELKFESVNLSFFEHFPVLTASVKNIELKGAAPFEKTTLLKAGTINLGIDIKSLFSNQVVIDHFYLNKAEINVVVDATGLNNYNILKGTGNAAANTSSGTELNLAIKTITISNTTLTYHDQSIPIAIKALGLNYEGHGDLSSTVIDLKSKATIASFSLAFDGESYMENKKINADLLTNINTKTLSFIFERNDLKLNDLPIKFRGEFGFLSNGYKLDFKVRTNKSSIANMLSVLPPAYAQWVKDTKVKGDGEAFMSLSGDYIAEKNIMPTLNFGLKLQNGLIAYKNTNVPVEHLNMGLRVDLPHLNLDSLKVNLDALAFQLAEGKFDAKATTQGLLPLHVKANIYANLDLGALHKALGIQKYDFKGIFKLDGSINGKYARAVKHSGIRQIDTVISSIPKFEVNSSFKNGYFKFASLKQPVDLIEFKLKALAKDSLISHSTVSFSEVNIKALTNFIKGNLHLQDIQKLKMDAHVQSEIDLASIQQFYPLDSIDLRGKLKVNFNASGHFDQSRNIFPTTQSVIVLKNGYIRSWRYALPIENIEVEAHVKSNKGSFRDLKVDILPISFKIADEPFFLRANLENFNNIKYNVQSKGKVNLEPFYKIFGLEGVNVAGYVNTNFSLAGLQQDALKGYYQRLKNKGLIEIGNITISSDLFPYPFYIRKGKFVFLQQKLKFDHITSQYKDNRLTLDGNINNYISYLTSTTNQLRGKLSFNSQHLDLNDFMVFAAGTPTGKQTSTAGVILIPKNLAIDFSTDIKKMEYNKLLIKNVNGELGVHQGQLKLSNTRFELAGMQVNMDGQYVPLHTNRAKFNYNIAANNFDIQRAYQEIPLFHDMVSSAKNAHGNVSVAYSLSGLLNGKMEPVLPTIAGGGKLTLENISFKGFKLLNNIAKETDHGKLNDASVSKVTINTTIKNNVMTIERTKMKVAFLRPRFEGQVDLNGNMNIGFRLGLPPFGIFGVPLTIKGTAEKPIIKLGRYKKEELDLNMDKEDQKLYDAEQAAKQDSLKKQQKTIKAI